MIAENTLQAEIVETEDRILDAIDEVISFWGFRGATGRVWGIMYLNGKPMSMDEIQERLGMSVGAVSMTIKELRTWGVVKKVHERSSRKTLYEPETNFWKMIARVLENREKLLIENASENIRQGTRNFTALAKKARGAEAAALKEKAERTRRLELLGAATYAILDSFISLQKVDASVITDIARIPMKVAKAVRKQSAVK